MLIYLYTPQRSKDIQVSRVHLLPLFLAVACEFQDEWSDMLTLPIAKKLNITFNEVASIEVQKNLLSKIGYIFGGLLIYINERFFFVIGISGSLILMYGHYSMALLFFYEDFTESFLVKLTSIKYFYCELGTCLAICAIGSSYFNQIERNSKESPHYFIAFYLGEALAVAVSYLVSLDDFIYIFIMKIILDVCFLISFCNIPFRLNYFQKNSLLPLFFLLLIITLITLYIPFGLIQAPVLMPLGVFLGFFALIVIYNLYYRRISLQYTLSICLLFAIETVFGTWYHLYNELIGIVFLEGSIENVDYGNDHSLSTKGNLPITVLWESLITFFSIFLMLCFIGETMTIWKYIFRIVVSVGLIGAGFLFIALILSNKQRVYVDSLFFSFSICEVGNSFLNASTVGFLYSFVGGNPLINLLFALSHDTISVAIFSYLSAIFEVLDINSLSETLLTYSLQVFLSILLQIFLWFLLSLNLKYVKNIFTLEQPSNKETVEVCSD